MSYSLRVPPVHALPKANFTLFTTGSGPEQRQPLETHACNARGCGLRQLRRLRQGSPGRQCHSSQKYIIDSKEYGASRHFNLIKGVEEYFLKRWFHKSAFGYEFSPLPVF